MRYYASSLVAALLLVFSLQFLAAEGSSPDQWLLASTKNAYPDGFPSSSIVFTYDSSGRMLRAVERNGSDIVVVQRAYTYKNNDQVEIATLDPNNQLRAKTIQEFGGGLLLREKIQDDSGTTQSSSEFTYDAKGRKTSWQLTSSVAGATSTEYTYDRDHLIRIVVLDSSKALIKRYERNFDNAGNLMRVDEYDGRGTLMRAVFYTWTGGLLTKEETRDPQGVSQKFTNYSYDVGGHPVRLEFYNKRGEMTEFQTQDWLDLDAAKGGN